MTNRPKPQTTRSIGVPAVRPTCIEGRAALQRCLIPLWVAALGFAVGLLVQAAAR